MDDNAALLAELRAIRATIKRIETRLLDDEPPQVIEYGDLRIDPGRRLVWYRGREINLAETEFKLLLSLAEYRGQVAPFAILMHRVWGSEDMGAGTLRWYVMALREKTDPGLIENCRAVGYRLEVEDDSSNPT